MLAEWDRRVGIAPLREQYERARCAWRKAGMRMARTKPTTLGGIAALVNYTRRELMNGAVDWNLSRAQDSRRRAYQNEQGSYAMTKLTQPKAVTGINPKLIAIAAKLDEAQAQARGVEARKGDDDPDGLAAEKAYHSIFKQTRGSSRH